MRQRGRMREPRGHVRFWVLLVILVALLSQVGTCVVIAWSVREVSQATMIAVATAMMHDVGCTMTPCCGSSCGSKLSVENLPRPEPSGLHRAPCSRHHGWNSSCHRSCQHYRHGKDSRRGWQARFMPLSVSICEGQIVQAKDTHPPRPDLIASSRVCFPCRRHALSYSVEHHRSSGRGSEMGARSERAHLLVGGWYG